jgi:hypothetical protein
MWDEIQTGRRARRTVRWVVGGSPPASLHPAALSRRGFVFLLAELDVPETRCGIPASAPAADDCIDAGEHTGDGFPETRAVIRKPGAIVPAFGEESIS